MRKAITSSLTRHDLVLTDDAIERVVAWADLARKHGRRTNLIGTFDPARIAEELVADSLQLLHLLDRERFEVIDVGSGAGVPGLILAAAHAPTARSLLIEPRQKRAMFLRHAVRALGAAEIIQIRCARLEDLDATALERDAARLWVSRAVFAPERWLDVVAEHAQTGDHCAVWCNEHLRPDDLVVHPGWTLRSHRPYRLQGPGARTVFLYRWRGTEDPSA